MKFRFLAAVAAALAVFTASANVQAAVVTSNGTVNTTTSTNFGVPGLNPPLEQVHTLFVQNGQLFTNQVNGAAFVPGSTVRTVGVASLTGLAGPGGTTTETLLDPATGRPLRVIFAVEGTITGLTADGNPYATFSRGSLFFTTALDDFNRFDPETWNFGGTFSRFDLASQTDILFGGDRGIVPAGNFSSDSEDVNQSVAVEGPGQGDGTFLFAESGFGNDFINEVEMPGGGTTDLAYLAGSTSQVLQPGVIALDDDQQDVLNAIGAAAGFSGAFNEGGYTPSGYGTGTGDFNASLSGELYVAAVPEPSSMAIFGLLCGGAAVRFTKRRFAKKAQ